MDGGVFTEYMSAVVAVKGRWGRQAMRVHFVLRARVLVHSHSSLCNGDAAHTFEIYLFLLVLVLALVLVMVLGMGRTLGGVKE